MTIIIIIIIISIIIIIIIIIIVLDAGLLQDVLQRPVARCSAHVRTKRQRPTASLQGEGISVSSNLGFRV